VSRAAAACLAGKLRRLGSRAEKERFVRAVRHADQLPAGNWPALWEALGTAAYEPRLVWEPSELAALHDEQRFIYLAGLSKS